MPSVLAILATVSLAMAAAIPIPKLDAPSSIQIQIVDSDPIVSKISPSEPAPGTILIEPPPLFDPPEPRPDPLFDSSSETFIIAETSRLKAPPIQESRTETLLPFDGAHVHPFATPYTPESLPGTCAYSQNCSLVRTSAEIGASFLFVAASVYLVVYMFIKLFRRILWTAKNTRSRSPSGSLRMEPELGNKLSESQQIGSDMNKAPLVKVWCEKGIEKVVFAG